MSAEKKPLIVLSLETTTPHEDGGAVVDTAIYSNGTMEQVDALLDAVADAEPTGMSSAIKSEKARRRRSSLGYTGRWNTDWDPHAPEKQILH